MALSVGCALVTFNAGHHLRHALTPLLNSTIPLKILIIDSSSTDNTLEIAEEFKIDVIKILQKDFNHGTTREMARLHLKTDIVVMLTQDAYFADATMLEKLIHPILTKQVSVAYARQIPHRNAKFFESFPRLFNYPLISEIRSLKDLPTHGTYTFFCSNSCAAYLNCCLDKIGGFSHVLLGEDTLATAKLLKNGHAVAYVSEAVVFHSHAYSLVQEFKRSFDTGYAREDYKEYLKGGSRDSKRGWMYAITMIKILSHQAPFLIPYACLHIFVKWLGFNIGKQSLYAPQWFKKMMSSQEYYW